MKYFASFLGLFVGSLLAWGQAKPAADDPVVLTVGTEKITKSQFERLLDALPEQQKALASSPDGKRKLAEQYAEMKALVQEAKAKKLDQTPIVQTRIGLQSDQVLAGAAYQGLGDAKPSDADLKAYYDQHKSEWETVKGRHILIRFQGSRVPLKLNQKDLSDEEALAKAKDLRAKIVAGAKFDEIAKAESDDTGSGANGGDLGEFSRGQMVPEFENAAFAQKVGEVGEPVKSAFGYHIIQIQEHATKTLDQAKPEIEEKMKPEMAAKGLEELKKKTAITLSDAYFGKP